MPRILLPLLILSIAAACYLGFSVESTEPAAYEEIKMFEKTQTWCFGRFLVDIPVDAELIGQTNEYHPGKIESGEGRPSFKAAVNEVMEKRKSEQDEDEYRYERIEYPENADKQIILSKAVVYDRVMYAIDAFAMSPRDKPGAGYYFFSNGKAHSANNVDNIMNMYSTLLSSVRYRGDREIPTEPGFCFKNGFVASDGSLELPEEAGLAFRLKNHPDVWIRVKSDIYWVADKSLLERTKPSVLDAVLPGKMRYDSQKKREVNGMKGEESLVHGPGGDGTGTSYIYVWETQGELKNPLKPGIHLEITAGAPVDGEPGTSSLEIQQVRALYESVLKTIRFRPVTEKPAAAQP